MPVEQNKQIEQNEQNQSRECPSEAGLYWARSDVEGWFNMIVSVQGKAPMLQIGWAVRLSGIDSPKLCKPAPYNIDEWCLRKIDEPKYAKKTGG